MSADLGPLLAAVTDDWERGKTIAARAGVSARGAGQKLASLEHEGLVEARATAWESPGRGAKLYRRGPNAAPYTAPRTAEQLLAGLRGKLDEMELHDDTQDPYDVGYMTCWRELKAWLDAAGHRPQP